MGNKKKVLASVLVVVFVFWAGSALSQMLLAQKGLSEEEIGLRKGTLYGEEQIYPSHGEFPTAQPGSSHPLGRAFENSPPLIPHDLTGMLPIHETKNICKSCHMPEFAPSIGATPIPKTHLMDMVTGKDLKGELDGKRHNCMQCHVPQVRIPPAVVNIFQGEFRDPKSKQRSNLIDNLNEGVELE